MEADLWVLYRQMLRSRLFEEAVSQLWHEGHISGEMHLGVGEEAIAAGVVDQLREGDAMALDYRGTPPLLMRGVDPVRLLREFLGRPDGLCAGMGGHMHLFAPSHLAASSGIVGATGPAAAGFALAAQYLRPGTVSVAFFGEGALNQGMLMEALNLAVVWKLPAVFVCKDNQIAALTSSTAVSGRSPVARARGLGMVTTQVDGGDVEAVWQAACRIVARAREGGGPAFLHAHCVHLEGHFLGDPLLRFTRQPLQELKETIGPMLRSFARRKGASLRDRAESLGSITSVEAAARKQTAKESDPLERARQKLAADPYRLLELEVEVREEMTQAVETALSPASPLERNER